MPSIEPGMLGQLYQQHAPALRLYAQQWSGGGEDLVHDAFVKLARQSPPPAQVLPWLYRVVRNEALAASRAAARRRRRETAASNPEAWFASLDNHVDAQDAVGLLAALPLELREVIVAHIWGGLSFEEIAQLTDSSSSTAHRRYVAGLSKLSQRLDKQWIHNPTPET